MKANELSNEETNKIIHEKLFGECWKIGREFTDDGCCTDCGICVQKHTTPDYCSGKSERDLLQEAVARAVERFGRQRFGMAIYSTIAALRTLTHSLELNAEQVARSIVACITEQENGK